MICVPPHSIKRITNANDYLASMLDLNSRIGIAGTGVDGISATILLAGVSLAGGEDRNGELESTVSCGGVKSQWGQGRAML